MRDLQAQGPPVLNGDQPSVIDAELEGPSPNLLADMRSQRRVVRRDQKLSEMAVLMIDTAKMVEPVVSMVGQRVLRWATLGSAVGLTAYAMSHPSWERAAIAGGFLLLSPVLWWRA